MFATRHLLVTFLLLTPILAIPFALPNPEPMPLPDKSDKCQTCRNNCVPFCNSFGSIVGQATHAAGTACIHKSCWKGCKTSGHCKD